ncbi:G elongation factor, mitochondrial 2 [Dermatophagoides farinae]|uniref:G elongation factor, mitochondrial 2 n=1 Tax=Dermatophagoides farinae TaxID=6954 RepID=A0A922I0P1_DERFA|nr:G elongation factor, mitochondrial 2 [Dermatophagoides farinae]
MLPSIFVIKKSSSLIFDPRWKMVIRHLSSETTKRIRNIGLVAHIDAGKTTTTERMLYYSGSSSQMGEVHHGDTVMDYMDQERERGITITMAAATIQWLKHHINIIDTPGHVDFTFEVERSLSVLDGAVVVLDSAAGVQAQTIKIWRQVQRFHIPGLFYANKMDKSNASLDRCLQSLKQKLHIEPLLLQLPVQKQGILTGIIDLINGNYLQWPLDHYDRLDLDHNSAQIQRHCLLSNELSTKCLTLDEHQKYRDEMYRERECLISKLSDFDETLADHVLSLDQIHRINPIELMKSIRKSCLKRQLFPLLIGSSYRNIGIQPLLDAICDYLPEPMETRTNQILHEHYTRNHTKPTSTTNLCALAFKIHYHQRLGLLTYLRIYSGSLTPGMNVYNLNRQSMEKITKIYRPFADHFREITATTVTSNHYHQNPKTIRESISNNMITIGDIIAVSGLSNTITGDTLIHTMHENDHDINNEIPMLAGIEIPEPVYYCSLECPSVSKFKQLELALDHLQREDPSLHVNHDQNTQQLIIKGMGELHIEIIKDRIKREYGIQVETGPLQVSYRETITKNHRETMEQTKIIGGHSNQMKISCEVRSKLSSLDNKHNVLLLSENIDQNENDLNHMENIKRKAETIVKIVNSKDHNLSSQIRPWQLKAIYSGVSKAMEYGPLFSFPVVDVQILLHEFEINSSSPLLSPFITNVTSHCILEALRQSKPILMEPIMLVEIITPEQFIGPIISDLTIRRSRLMAADNNQQQQQQSSETEQIEERHILAQVPLAELFNYSTTLRTITSGMATFDLRLHSYRPLDSEQTANVIKLISGIE